MSQIRKCDKKIGFHGRRGTLNAHFFVKSQITFFSFYHLLEFISKFAQKINNINFFPIIIIMPKQGKGFTQSEIDHILECIEEVYPIGTQGWERVHEKFQLLHPDSDRTKESIKKSSPNYTQARYQLVIPNALLM